MTVKDLDGLSALCSADVSIELVGGAEFDGFEPRRDVLRARELVTRSWAAGGDPSFEPFVYEGEPFPRLPPDDGLDGLNESIVSRSSTARRRIRCYCFCPDTLRLVAEHLGIRAVRRPYRSPG